MSRPVLLFLITIGAQDPVKPAPLPDAIVDFSEFLSGTFSSSDPDRMVPMLARLSALARNAGEWQNYAKAASLIAGRCWEGTWSISPDDRRALNEYVKIFFVPVDHRGAALFLALRLETATLPPPRWRVLRLLALAHLAEALKTSPKLKSEILEYAKGLDLVQEGLGKWITAEGQFVLAVRGKKAKGELRLEVWKSAKFKDPIGDAFKAVSLFEAMGGAQVGVPKEIVAECLAACAGASAPQLVAPVKKILEENLPCAKCGGTRKAPCPTCNGSGEAPYVCPTCGGTGKMGKLLGERQCIEPRPGTPKTELWKGIHKSMIRCGVCLGSKVATCTKCSGVWMGGPLLDDVVFSPCASCDATGWLIADVKALCHRCAGMGKTAALSKRK